jgi:CO/xanthine dehydrogenase Mo-binding subunit
VSHPPRPTDDPESFEQVDALDYRFELTRRSFLHVLGAGIVVTATSASDASSQQSVGSNLPARLHISENGVITVLTSKVEVGQGSRTQITLAAAEELRVDPASIELIMADTDVVPDDGGTFGSLTTPRTVPVVRKAAAAAREVLIELAANRWQCGREALAAREGAVVNEATQEKLDYANLAGTAQGEAALKTSRQDGVSLASVREWRVLGRSLPRVRGRDIVTGSHRYPSDVQQPGMLYGAVLRPPSFGATLESIALDLAEPGVVIARDGDFVGCAASTSHAARKTVASLRDRARWSTRPHPSSSELFTYLKEHAVGEGAGRRGPHVDTQGSIARGIELSRHVLEASYEVSYIQHAPMEPRAAVAEWEGERLTVWTGTQRPMAVRSEVAAAFHLRPEQVRVIVPDTGGGFGGKHTGEVAVEAARLAREAGRPVSLRWTREEEFTWAYFRPAGLIEIRAGLDAQGIVQAWEFTNYNSGPSALRTPYAITNRRERFLPCDSPLREGSYRALAATANIFARESFTDELAHAARMTPVEFRLAHMEDPRLRSVLESVVERFRFSEKFAQLRDVAERGVGLACGTEKGSYVAAAVEVRLDRSRGRVHVEQICQAFECGAIQNPANLKAQIEGAIIQGLGGVLTEEIRFEDGRVRNPHFGGYRVPRSKDVPPMDLLLMDRPDLPSAGAGETPLVAVAPAIANAVFHASGIRCRTMPLGSDRLRSG